MLTVRPQRRREGRDPEIFSFRFEQAEHRQRPVDRLSAGATDSLRQFLAFHGNSLVHF